MGGWGVRVVLKLETMHSKQIQSTKGDIWPKCNFNTVVNGIKVGHKGNMEGEIKN